MIFEMTSCRARWMVTPPPKEGPMKLLATSTALGLLVALGAVAPASADGNATVEATAMALGGGGQAVTLEARDVLPPEEAAAYDEEAAYPETDQPATDAAPAASAPSADQPQPSLRRARQRSGVARQPTTVIRTSRSKASGTIVRPCGQRHRDTSGEPYQSLLFSSAFRRQGRL